MAQFRPPNLILTTIGLSLATFMRVLDTTIANVSLPTIAGNLGVSDNQSTWVITSFTVAMAISLPLTGWLSRRFGEVKLFVWCTVLFSAASFMCGVSGSIGMLLLFRVIQGAVSGPMYPVTQSLLIAVYPTDKRGLALALLGMVTVVAPIAGPILGGWITDSYSWRWIFFINVPIGIFCSVAIGAQLAAMKQDTERPRFDYVGLITLIIGVGALQIMLDKGNQEDWFHSTFIITLTIIAVIALAIFVIWEMTDEDPIVDLRLFRHRNFAAGTLVLVLAYAVFFGINLLIPQWLQRTLGYTALWAGFATAPLGVFPVLLTYFVGKYAGRFDLRYVAAIAFVVIAATCFMRSDFNTNVDFFTIAEVQLIMGIGVALFFMPVLTILLSDLKTNEIASGSGLSTFLRTVGGSFAASITTFLWQRRAATHHARIASQVTNYDPSTRHALESMGQGQPKHQAADMINSVVTQQGFQMSFNDLMYALGFIFLGLIAVLWLAKPPFNASDTRAGGD